MRRSLTAVSVLMAIMLFGTIASADQIILRDGTIYTGTFVRGDSRTVDFRILGRTENFQITDIARIVFSEPVLEAAKPPRTVPEPPSVTTPPSVPTPSPEPEAVPKAAQTNPPQRIYRDDSESTITFPEGTPVVVRTTTAIDTDRNRVGDVFNAILDEPLEQDGYVFAPRGAKVLGKIVYAEESGKLSGRSQLMLELTELIVKGKTYYLNTADYVEEGSSRGKRTAGVVGGTAAIGAIIGAIAGGGKGAAIGAASGAGAGTGVQILTRGEVIKIPAETILEFKLYTPMTVNIP